MLETPITLGLLCIGVAIVVGATFVVSDAMGGVTEDRVGWKKWKLVIFYVTGWLVLASIHRWSEEVLSSYLRSVGVGGVPATVRWFNNSIQNFAAGGYHFLVLLWFLLRRERGEYHKRRIEDRDEYLKARYRVLDDNLATAIEQQEQLIGLIGASIHKHEEKGNPA
jgi:hypothetical protein